MKMGMLERYRLLEAPSGQSWDRKINNSIGSESIE